MNKLTSFVFALCLFCLIGELGGVTSKKGEEKINLPTNLKIEKSYFGLGFATFQEFTSDGAVIFSGDLKAIEGKIKKYVVWDGEGAVAATASRYKAIPSNNDLYVVRDDSSRVIGYIEILNNSILDFFKPLSAIVYNAQGVPLLETIQDYAILMKLTNFKTTLYGDKDTVVIKAKSKKGISSLVYNIRILENIDIDQRLLMMLLHTQTNRPTIQKSLATSVGSLEFKTGSFALDSDQSNISVKSLHEDVVQEAAEDVIDYKSWEKAMTILSQDMVYPELEGDELAEVVLLVSQYFSETETITPDHVAEVQAYMSPVEKGVLFMLINQKFEAKTRD